MQGGVPLCSLRIRLLGFDHYFPVGPGRLWSPLGLGQLHCLCHQKRTCCELALLHMPANNLHPTSTSLEQCHVHDERLAFDLSILPL